MRRRLALGALILATLAACASEPRHGRRGPPGAHVGGEGRTGPPRPRLFISPSGEPFRGENGLATWFAGADADHDGAVSRAEFQADALRFFKVLDANHDGVLDGFEIQAYERERVPEIGAVDLLEGFGPDGEGPRRIGGGGRTGRRGGGRRGGQGGEASSGGDQRPMQAPGAGREGAARYSLLNEPEPVAGADLDLDGRVTLDEWKRATAHRFEVLDKAGSGRLILSDLILPPGARKPPEPPRPEPSR
jgi:hypothetical protein